MPDASSVAAAPAASGPGAASPHTASPHTASPHTADPGIADPARADLATASPLPAGLAPRWGGLAILAAFGPGLVVMLADSDAGSVITAAQSGARWGYRMIVPQLALIPVLYLIQELAARIGAGTGTGYMALIGERFGRRWAVLAATALGVSALGAVTTEFAAVAGVGELFGVSRWLTVPIATIFLLAVSLAGSHRRVELIGLALGLAEIAFLPAIVLGHPSGRALAGGLASAPLGDGSYRYLLAANVGAVIMPWMICYQQNAVASRGRGQTNIRRERAATATGAVLTQVVMISVVMALAATSARAGHGGPLTTVGEVAAALRPFFGPVGARALFGAGMLGAALVAALVSSLAMAWSVSDLLGWRPAPDRCPLLGRPAMPHQPARNVTSRPGRRRGGFYAAFGLLQLIAAILVLASVDLVRLAVAVEVMNAALLPIMLGFLLALEATALPPALRARPWYRYLTWAVSAAVIGFSGYLLLAH